MANEYLNGQHTRMARVVEAELVAMRAEMTAANDRVFNALVFQKGDLVNAKSARRAIENRFDRLAQELIDARRQTSDDGY